MEFRRRTPHHQGSLALNANHQWARVFIRKKGPLHFCGARDCPLEGQRAACLWARIDQQEKKVR